MKTKSKGQFAALTGQFAVLTGLKGRRAGRADGWQLTELPALGDTRCRVPS